MAFLMCKSMSSRLINRCGARSSLMNNLSVVSTKSFVVDDGNRFQRYRKNSNTAAVNHNNFGSSLPDVVKSSGWEGAWAQGITPWDAGKPAPILTELLASSSSSSSSTAFITTPLPSVGDVLVPGAGMGYDALSFARAGRKTIAIDIAPTALASAHDFIKNKTPDGASYLSNGMLELRHQDFFSQVQAFARYGVIFDYTFLSALPRDLWGAWADTVTRLIHPDGELVSILFPIGDFKTGPPFAMQSTTVRDLLVPRGWEEIFLEPIPDSSSHPARQGREWLGRYTLKSNRHPGITPTAAQLAKFEAAGIRRAKVAADAAATAKANEWKYV